jgi:hypothetical protein
MIPAYRRSSELAERRPTIPGSSRQRAQATKMAALLKYSCVVDRVRIDPLAACGFQA